jgi:hypothetical protein
VRRVSAGERAAGDVQAWVEVVAGRGGVLARPEQAEQHLPVHPLLRREGEQLTRVRALRRRHSRAWTGMPSRVHG